MYFESKVYILNTVTGVFTEVGDFYTNDKHTIDIDVKNGEIIALIGLPQLDSGSYYFEYDHKGKAGFRMPWWGILLIVLFGLCFFLVGTFCCLFLSISCVVKYLNVQAANELKK